MLKAKNSDCIDMIRILRNIYFLSKEKIALYKSESIHQLNEINGSIINENHRNHVTAHEIMTIIAKVYRNEILVNISKSPFIGLQLDESPDINSTFHLSQCIQYLCNNEVKSHFVCLFELDNQKSDTLFEIICSFLNRHKLEKKTVAISVDGLRCCLISMVPMANYDKKFQAYWQITRFCSKV